MIALAREDLRIFDPDARQLGLGSRDRTDRLFSFLRGAPTRRLRIVLHDVRHLEIDCPRFVQLCAQFGAQVQVQVTRGVARRAQDCFIVADTVHLVRRPVAAQPRGVLIEDDPSEAASQRDRFEEIWEDSDPGMTATVAGLG